jgi:TonB-dependent starch-binding outer membrane protein SusC
MKSRLFDSGFQNESIRNALKRSKLIAAFFFAFLLILPGLSVASTSINSGEEQVQIKEISGSVKDNQGLPLQGVSIAAKGTTVGTISDSNGQFKLSVPSEAKTLIFSFIGMKSQEIQIGDLTTFNVVLLEESYLVDEIVVIGYGKTAKKDLTGAVTVVESKDMNKGVYSSPAQLLQGKVPGLLVTRSGDPSATASVTLRGPSTLRTGAAMEPFYIIDGVPGASIDAVAPDDIVSINVMRDASSTAIYGSRAANGLIIVTTRRAKNNESYVSYNGYVAFEKVSNRIEMLSAEELRSYLEEVNKVPLDDDGSSTNWQDEVMRTGISQNHNISFGHASDKTRYSVSANYLNNQGIIKTSSMDRLTARISVEQQMLNDRVILGLNLTNTQTNQHVVREELFSNMLKYLPTIGIYNPDGTYFQNTQNSNYHNPVAILDNDIDDRKIGNVLTNATIKVNITKGLTYDANVSYQNTEIKRNIYDKQASTLKIGSNGFALRNEYANRKTLFENYLTYENTFGQNKVTLLGGYSWEENKLNDGFQAANSNFVTDDLLYYNLSLGSSPDKVTTAERFGTATIQTLRLISFYGRINYQFSDRYLLQATLRRDGSSAFGTNNQWGTFPSVSLGWRISNESFMDNQKIFSDLKLRVGYGVSGNSLGFDPMISKMKYGLTGVTYINGNQVQSIGVTQNENPDLKWESTAMTNIGLDFGFLKNRITGTIEVYDKLTSDLIWYYPVKVPPYLYPYLWANVGEISNRGIEFQIDAVAVQGNNFRWTTSFNISSNKNEVKSLSNDQFETPETGIWTAIIGGKGQSGNPTQVIKEGYPLGTFFLRQWAGRDESNVSLFYAANGDKLRVVTVDDFAICGSAQPDLIFGWNNSFSYKKIDLSFFFRGVTGNTILNGTLAALNDVNYAASNNIPRWSLNEPIEDINSFYYSDRFLESGSYVRLDNATLGYTIDLKKIKLKSARVYLTGNNIFVITKYRGVDPEINMGGIEPGIDNNNFYPKTRSFMVGLNLNF